MHAPCTYYSRQVEPLLLLLHSSGFDGQTEENSLVSNAKSSDLELQYHCARTATDKLVHLCRGNHQANFVLWSSQT